MSRNPKSLIGLNQVDTLAFRSWFCGSKVVVGDGAPLVVFHGTSTDFAEFRIPVGDADLGAHFGGFDQANIRSIGGESVRIMPVYLSIKNPLRLQDGGDFLPDEVYRQLEDLGIEVEVGDDLGIGPLRRAIVSAGYDGVVYLNRREVLGLHDPYGDATLGMFDDEVRNLYPAARDSWIAFRPEQIKSVFNRGDFDPTSPNICMSRVIRERAR